MRKLFPILLLAAALFLAGCGASAESGTPAAQAPAAAPTETPGQTPAAAPTETPAQASAQSYDGLVFSATDRNGKTWDESVFAENRLTMINFWEPWCGPCVGEMPDLQRLQEDYADRGLRILGVYSTDGAEDDVDAVLAYTGASYPILHYTEAFQQFQSGYVPTTIFVDADGHVIGEGAEALCIGSRSYEDWAAIVEALL